MATRYYDLRQPFYEGMSYIKRLGAPTIQPRSIQRRYGDVEDAVNVTDYQFNTHLGTHVDAPRHVYNAGRTIDEFPIEAFCGRAVVLDVRCDRKRELLPRDLEQGGPTVERGDIVLLHTGWSARFGTPSYDDHPYLGNDAAGWLAERGIKMLGMDTITPDLPAEERPPDYPMPAHRILLGRDIFIIENVGDLSPVLGRRLFVSAVPTRIRGADGAPAALFAWDEVP